MLRLQIKGNILVYIKTGLEILFLEKGITNYLGNYNGYYFPTWNSYCSLPAPSWSRFFF